MTGSDVREKYLKFFTGAPRNHKEISPAPLVLENDPTTLFTSSGMQPLVPYLMGEAHPRGERLVDSQPSIRTVDIDEVGDNLHLTFFEMLGNWSLGDYFKKEQLPWIYEFFTKELGLSSDRLWVSVFEGNKEVPKDNESAVIWKSLGIPEERIRFYSVEKNWWSRTGTPQEMPVGEIGGPDSEVFFEFPEVKHDPKYGKDCHPNCDCGRFLEIGNSVFIQYKKVGENKLEELPNKNVDFGGGLERITAAVNNEPDIFKSDLFYQTIQKLEEISQISYASSEEIKTAYRIISDHLRAAAMLIRGDVTPGNKRHNYILRRLLRRSMVKVNKLFDMPVTEAMQKYDFSDLMPFVVLPFKGTYLELTNKEIVNLKVVVKDEQDKFLQSLNQAYKPTMKVMEKEGKIINGKEAFDLYQTYGLLPDVIEELALKFGKTVQWEEFKKLNEKHSDDSRTTSAGVFKGGLADHSSEVIRLHTATHLLLASLRKILGDQVVQKGQNITQVRSRFDFPNPEKLTDAQLKEVEEMINDVIKKDLPVNFVVLPKEEALKTGAIHAFNEKYADTVKVYTVGPTSPRLRGTRPFSREFCGGPHVTHTGEIGHVRIKKQEKIGAGLIRIYIVVE